MSAFTFRPDTWGHLLGCSILKGKPSVGDNRRAMLRVIGTIAFALLATGAALGQTPLLLPRPRSIATVPCRSEAAPASVAASADPGGVEILDRRLNHLGLAPLRVAKRPAIVFSHAPMPAQAYRLTVRDGRAWVISGDSAGAFYAMTTLAQLIRARAGRAIAPCVRVVDAPALGWRVLSDDVSRGPLPTMRYFRRRIRTIAAFKMNGYSPYMENTFVSPSDPLPAPLDGITPRQLGELARYAARFHVALIPEQQTFAHMHNTLKYERYAAMAELPHGFLLSPANPAGLAYAERLVRQELAVVPHPPFFHIGSDETAMLGDGQSAAMVKKLGKARVYADHVDALAAVIAPSGARTMLWDDGVETDPAIAPLLPKNVVLIDWHYGNDRSFTKYIDLVAKDGFQQMVAPGANNWNEIFPDLDTAIPNERRFIDEGKAAHVLGLFQTVWHDDGETLYATTWYPVLYAAADAWDSRDLSPRAFARAFPETFFGVDDPRYASDIAALADAVHRLDAAPHEWTDRLFWSDPFEAKNEARMKGIDLSAVRLEAERVEQHLLDRVPPAHRGAAFAEFVAARRIDVLARAYQIAHEVRYYYDDARAHIGEKNGPSFRDLLWCKYWFWELRDWYEGLAPLYARAWKNESRPGHLASNLERYHLAAQRAIRRADLIQRATYNDYIARGTLPPLDRVLRLP